MDENFWQNKWATQQTAFHLDNVNPALCQYFSAFNLKQGQRIFVPLCGKSLDMVWLAQHGLEVLGCELVESAVVQFFQELDLPPQIEHIGELKKYSANNFTIFVGNVFDLTSELMGHVDAIYDRAAYVALPQAMRQKYAQHTQLISNYVDRLLVVLEYDQSQIDGPPFAISEQEVCDVFGQSQSIEKLGNTPVVGSLKGKVEAQQTVYILTSKAIVL